VTTEATGQQPVLFEDGRRELRHPEAKNYSRHEFQGMSTITPGPV